MPSFKTQTRFYRVWNSMRQRCENPNDNAYHYYGGRGIGVDPKWKVFKNFYDDMFPSYRQGLWLDRIDNSKGYCKKNCRWATRVEQANNKRNNRFFEYNGKKATLPQWSRMIGVKRSTLSQRIYVYDWSIERTLTTP